jgi:hypothetical protein
MKLLIMKFSPLPCYFVPLRPKYSPQRPILKHPQRTFILNVNGQVSHPYKAGQATDDYIACALHAGGCKHT